MSDESENTSTQRSTSKTESVKPPSLEEIASSSIPQAVRNVEGAKNPPQEADGVQIAKARVDADAIVYADEATHWDVLDMNFQTGRINHSELYSDRNGKHTNWVESYFSRLRRMVQGQHHHVSHKYLYQYANHAAWCEDHRRRSNGGNAAALLGSSLNHPVSRVWAGYWQRSAA